MVKGKKDKQLSTKHYRETKRSSNMNPTKNQGWTQVLRMDKPFLFNVWHQSCYSCYTFDDVINNERTWKYWRQVEHISDDLWTYPENINDIYSS